MKKQGKQKKKKEFPNEYSVTLKIFLAYKFNKNRWQSLFKKKKRSKNRRFLIRSL